MGELSEYEDHLEMTNGYPILEWWPGNPIDDKDNVHDVADKYEGDNQGASDTDGKEYKYLNET